MDPPLVERRWIGMKACQSKSAAGLRRKWLYRERTAQ
jgi:hypothetical protein